MTRGSGFGAVGGGKREVEEINGGDEEGFGGG